MKPLGYYVSAPTGHPDANILESIEQQFGCYLQNLTKDDKASVQIWLIECVFAPKQILVKPNFYSSENGAEFWRLAERLSFDSLLALSVAIANFLLYGERN